MEKLHEAITNKGTEFYRVKISKFKERIFKTTYENRNGVSGISVQIMTNNGDFAYFLSKFDIGYELTCSYIATEDAKLKDSKNGISVAEKLVTKIYGSL